MNAVVRRILGIARIDPDDSEFEVEGEGVNASDEACHLARKLSDLSYDMCPFCCCRDVEDGAAMRRRSRAHRMVARYSKRPSPSSFVHSGTARPMIWSVEMGPK